MDKNLTDFTREQLECRIKEGSTFCELKNYSSEQLTDGVTKVSFQIAFDTLGCVLFFVPTLGYKTISNYDKVNEYIFDNASGRCIGQDIDEAVLFYNNECESSIGNFNFESAENYARTQYGLQRTYDSTFKYVCIKKINQIRNLVSQREFNQALYYLEHYDNEILEICRSKKELFVSGVRNCCKFEIPLVNIKKTHFYNTLNDLDISYINNISETITTLNRLKSIETGSIYKDCLDKIMKNLRRSKNGIDYLKNGNFENAKLEFDQIEDGCFDEYKKYSKTCNIAIIITNNLKNMVINESDLQKLIDYYSYLKGDARFKFINLHKVCMILKNTISNGGDSFEYYFKGIEIYKEAIKVNQLKDIGLILNDKLNKMRLEVEKICESFKKNVKLNIKNEKYSEAVNECEKCCELAKKYKLKNELKYTKLAVQCQNYSNAEKLWNRALNLESSGCAIEARRAFNNAKRVVEKFEKYFHVKTNLSERIENKIAGNILINEGLANLSEPESITYSYNLIQQGYNYLKKCGDKKMENSMKKIEKLLQLKIDDDKSKFELISIPYPEEKTEEVCSELITQIQLRGGHRGK